MYHHPTARLRRAFTLVELLVVMAIIGLLAALLLPAVQKTLVKTKQTWCGNNLKQIGIGFHSFAHEHGSLFPQQVRLQSGGVLESSLTATPTVGEIWLRPEAFRVLSNELGNVRIVFCPATKLSASNFASLRPAQLTYFLNLQSRYAQPDSLISGDNNLDAKVISQTNNGTLLALRWTPERHDRRGNLLFADGHVEGRRDITYFSRPEGARPPGSSSSPLPTVRPGGGSSPSSPASPSSPSSPAPADRSAGSGYSTPSASYGRGGAMNSAPARRTGDPAAARAPGVSSPASALSGSPAGTPSPQKLPHEEVVERTFWWIYLLLLALGLIAVTNHFWRRQRERERRRNTVVI